MIKLTTDTLEEAYQQATKALSCSVTHIHLEIIQYPRNIFGIIKRKAIVLAYKVDDEGNGIPPGQESGKEESAPEIIDIKEKPTTANHQTA